MLQYDLQLSEIFRTGMDSKRLRNIQFQTLKFYQKVGVVDHARKYRFFFCYKKTFLNYR